MNNRLFLQEKEEAVSLSIRLTPFGKNWRKDIPNHGGVYVIWEQESPVYVGETSGLHSRMADLMRPVNHAFTKKISSKTEIKDIYLLRDYIAINYSVSYIPVAVGRAEIEEYLILRWRNSLMNKPTKRLLEGTQYSWVNVV